MSFTPEELDKIMVDTQALVVDAWVDDPESNALSNAMMKLNAVQNAQVQALLDAGVTDADLP